MSPDSDGFGSPEVLSDEPRRRGRVPRPLIFAAAAALVVTTGVGVAAASSQSPTPATTPTATAASPTETPAPTATPSDKSRGRGWGGWRHRWLGMGAGIHGEFVVPDGDGKYVTMATQFGDVTAVAATSVTVKSEDGYTKTYTVNGDTGINAGREDSIDSVKVGNKVYVTATVSGETATAVSIFNASQSEGPGWSGKGRWYHRGSDQTPSPAITPSPETTPAPDTTPTPENTATTTPETTPTA